MDSQKDLARKICRIFTDWLIQVHTRFHLLTEILYLAVNIIDLSLSARVVSFPKLQLVGITCMFLAAKVEEIVAPSAINFLYGADPRSCVEANRAASCSLPYPSVADGLHTLSTHRDHGSSLSRHPPPSPQT